MLEPTRELDLKAHEQLRKDAEMVRLLTKLPTARPFQLKIADDCYMLCAVFHAVTNRGHPFEFTCLECWVRKHYIPSSPVLVAAESNADTIDADLQRLWLEGASL